ncbi:MAG: hypothetical protein DMG50_04220 [Acidobacteria bacterium]|nr:MAG: hypothetical protein AUH16_02120 [Acidobacteria bacterium 13_2_20CM_57_7]PYU84547.1 MAG: hypothetical protein DMG50_04220 [Acidobacteriota bacterium]
MSAAKDYAAKLIAQGLGFLVVGGVAKALGKGEKLLRLGRVRRGGRSRGRIAFMRGQVRGASA